VVWATLLLASPAVPLASPAVPLLASPAVPLASPAVLQTLSAAPLLV